MCTVSVIALPGAGFRLVSSRDESPTRIAEPPAWRELAAARAIWPTDRRAGGTWVACADHGLALTLLNLNLPDSVRPAPDRRVSRGMLIPDLIPEPDAGSAIDALARVELARFDPFRLVAVDARSDLRVMEARWDGEALTRRDVQAPACFASSGLGDERVLPRLPLFDALVAPDPGPEAQDSYHAHRWPDRPEISVMMEREGAATTSVTRVEVRFEGGRFDVRMGYEPVDRG